MEFGSFMSAAQVPVVREPFDHPICKDPQHDALL
jgi:hypothetical protein